MSVASKGLALNRTRTDTTRVAALTLSGAYVALGDTVDLTLLTNPKGIDAMKQFSRVPDFFEVMNCPIAFNFQLITGVDNKSHKLKIWDEVAGTELAAGAYPAALTGADAITIAFYNKQGV